MQQPMNPEEETPIEDEPSYPIEDKPENRKPGPSPIERKQKDFIKTPIHFFIDVDGDGVPNHLEISKFKTNPFKEDTDDDGLSDAFEIMYHSATSFYYSFECMEYDWRDFVTSTMKVILDNEKEVGNWKEIRLNPLRNDGDQNGILDHLEDFDGDGVLNYQEQLLGTNPYIHNENGNYVGPTGSDLLKIMKNAKKGCH